MDSIIEDLLIEAVKHPAQTLAILTITAATFSILHIVYKKLFWLYRKEKFFKQLEMRFYDR